jgi:large subunit ribosomal protein L4
MNKYLENRKRLGIYYPYNHSLTKKLYPRWMKYKEIPSERDPDQRRRMVNYTRYRDFKKKEIRYDSELKRLCYKGKRTLVDVYYPGVYPPYYYVRRPRSQELQKDVRVLPEMYDVTFNKIQQGSPSNHLIHRDILRLQLSQKQGTVSTKTRSEVRGGGKKPWRQKGTGRARAGSSRSPLWKGGGVIFGPKPKTVTLKVNKKERRLAIQTLLWNKRNLINIIDPIEEVTDFLRKPKTAIMFKHWNYGLINQNEKVLFIVGQKKARSFKRVTRNLKNVEVINANHLNTLSLLKATRIYVTALGFLSLRQWEGISYCRAEAKTRLLTPLQKEMRKGELWYRKHPMRWLNEPWIEY